jgi:hypothetical protein
MEILAAMVLGVMTVVILATVLNLFFDPSDEMFVAVGAFFFGIVYWNLWQFVLRAT